jgi:hypothetical protein
MWWREMQRCGVAGAFRPVGVDMYAFDNSWAAAMPPGRVQPFKDFCVSRGECVTQPAGGKIPPGR